MAIFTMTSARQIPRRADRRSLSASRRSFPSLGPGCATAGEAASDGCEARRLRVPRIDHLADVSRVEVEGVEGQRLLGLEEPDLHLAVLGAELREVVLQPGDAQVSAADLVVHDVDRPERSEERRVGKECRSWWSPSHSK